MIAKVTPQDFPEIRHWVWMPEEPYVPYPIAGLIPYSRQLLSA